MTPLEQVLEETAQYEHALFEFSAREHNGMIELAVAELGPEKILYGSDMPLLDPHTQKAKVTGAEISDPAKALILGGNMARILGVAA